MDKCMYCGITITSENKADSYEDIHFICHECKKEKATSEKWESEKEHFAEVDYKYE